MNEQAKVNIKQRIVGAIVLVSLGIIIIPMLLDGGKDQKQGISNSNIPVLPSHLEKDIAPVPEAKPGHKAKPVLVRPVDELISESTEIVKSKTPGNKASVGQYSSADTARKKPVKSKTKPVQEGKTEVSQKVTKSEKKSSSRSVNDETVSKPKTTHIDTAYTIQVGSFSNKTNAFTLRDKLRKDKFQAYI